MRGGGAWESKGANLVAIEENAKDKSSDGAARVVGALSHVLPKDVLAKRKVECRDGGQQDPRLNDNDGAQKGEALEVPLLFDPCEEGGDHEDEE